MYKTILLALVWLVFFEGKTASPNIQPETLDETSRCSLPAPRNVHWWLLGNTHAFYVWDPVPGAAYFKVKVFTSPGNTMIFSRLVTALPENNGVAFKNLVFNASYKVEVHSVCSNGVDSPRNN